MIPFVGWQKTSLIDYPQRLSTILFTKGCNLRCPYCHNPQLVVDSHYLPPIPEEMLWEHLHKRRKVLDAVVITGGEPTIHGSELTKFITQVKELDLLVKLDTNGTNPSLLKELINDKLIDYVAMDIKTSISNYPSLSESSVQIDHIKDSIQLLQESSAQKLIDLEFRSTLHPQLHSIEIFSEMVKLIANAPLYVIQTFRNTITLNTDYQQTQPFTDSEMTKLKEIAQLHVQECTQR